MGRRSLAVLASLLIASMAVAQVEAARPDAGTHSGDLPLVGQVPPYFDHYSSVAEMTSFLQTLAASHPSVTNLTSIGSTLQGRTIWGLLISNEPGVNNLSKPTIIIDAMHHAREWLTSEVVMYIAYYTLENYQNDPELWNTLNTTQVWLIPKLNVDGFVYDGDGSLPGRWWRKNRRANGDGTFGVDLNRNYDRTWNKGSSNTNSPVYHGASPFSEPESRAIRDLVLGWNTSIYLSYHTYSELILYPWGDTTLKAPDDLLLRALGFEMRDRIPNLAGGERSYTVMQAVGLYPVYGSSMDWVYAQTRAPSYTIELYPDAAGGTFYPSESSIPDVVEDNVQAALFLMDVAASPEAFLMDLAVSPTSHVVNAGSTATYDVLIQNNLPGNHDFHLEVAGVPSNWSVNMPAQVYVPPQSAKTVQLDVSTSWDDPGGSATIDLLVEVVDEEYINRSARLQLIVNPIVREVGVTVDAPPDQTVPPGETVIHDFVVTNTGNVADTFSLVAASQQGWPLTSVASVTLGAGAQGVVQVSVVTPAAGDGGTVDVVTLAATSDYDANFSAVAVANTTLETFRSVSITSPPTEWVYSGDFLTLRFQVDNGGNVLENLLVTVTDVAGWPQSAPSSIQVAKESTAMFDVLVNVPPAALAGATDVVTVQMESAADPTVVATDQVDLHVLRRSEVAVTAPPSSSGPPGAAVSYDFQVTNLGNAREVFRMVVAADLGWTVTGPSEVWVDAYSSGNATYEVSVPEDALEGATAVLTVTATSLYDVTATASAIVGAVVDRAYGVWVSPGQAETSVDPASDGYPLALNFTLENTGNAEDTFVPSWDVPDGWTATVTPQTLTLDPASYASIKLTVTVPDRAAAGEYAVTVSVSSLGGPEANATSTVSLLRPDLVLVDFVAERNKATEGDTVAVKASVKNTGRGASPAADVAVYIEGTVDPVLVTVVSGIAPGGMLDVTFDVALSDVGERTVTVKVDPDDIVVEEDESPQEMSVVIHVEAGSQGVSAFILPLVILLVAVPIALYAVWRRRREGA